MSKNGVFEVKGYDSFSGCDMIVTARLSQVAGYKIHESVYTLGSLQTLSISTHQDKQPIRAIGNMNAIDYTMGQRTIAGSMVFAVFDRHFASEMFEDLKEITGKDIILPDELPPLDITITFANEYGRTSRMAVYGIRLVNEGQVMSINDVYTENTYQFVANSLEPLNKGDSAGSNTSSKNDAIVTPVTSFSTAASNEGKQIVRLAQNSNISINTEDIRLTAEIEQPGVDNTYGIAKFQLTPKQSNGHIKISNLTDGKTKKIYLENLSQQTYIYAELEYGKYTATYYGEEEYKYSNTVSFVIEGHSNIHTEKNDQPIIERVSHNEMLVSSNNISHTHVICEPESMAKQSSTVFELNSKKALITGLIPNANYIVKTADLKGSNSKSTTVRTLSYEKQDIKLFLEYINNNKKLLIDDYSKYVDTLEEVKNTNMSNIIDAITIQESTPKTQELLLYAIKFQNEFNMLINDSTLSVPEKVLSEPFWNTLKHDSKAVKSNYFYTKKTKNYFSSSVSYPSMYKFEGATNRRHYAYDIDGDSSRGVRLDFCSFSEDTKALLGIYKNTDMVSQLDITNYKAKYPKASTQTLYEVACKDKKQNSLKILKSPIVNHLEEMLHVDVDYTEVIGQSEDTFYLCLSNINEALDYTPFRKIPFTGDMTNLILDKYVTGVLDNRTYLAWIENNNYDVISTSTIFKTYEDTPELSYVNRLDIDKELQHIKKALESRVGKEQLIDTIFAYISASEPKQKLLYEVLEQEMVNYLYNQAKSDTYLLELLKVKFDRDCFIKDLCDKVIYSKDSKSIRFETDKPVHIAIFEYSYNEELPRKSSKVIDSTVHLNATVNYTLIYLVENSLMATSGFVLINNSTGICHSYNMKVEVI